MMTSAPKARHVLLRQPQTLRSASLGSTNAAQSCVQRRRKNITNACQQCRVKKRRCNGKQPCLSCMEKHLPCHFQTCRDGRRVRDASKTFSKLSERLSKYEYLFTTLRSSPSSNAIRILLHMRSYSNESLQQPSDSNDLVLDMVLRYIEDTSTERDGALRAVSSRNAKQSKSSVHAHYTATTIIFVLNGFRTNGICMT